MLKHKIVPIATCVVDLMVFVLTGELRLLASVVAASNSSVSTLRVQFSISMVFFGRMCYLGTFHRLVVNTELIATLICDDPLSIKPMWITCVALLV